MRYKYLVTAVLVVLTAVSIQAQENGPLPIAKAFMRSFYVLHDQAAVARYLFTPAAAAKMMEHMPVRTSESEALEQAVNDIRVAAPSPVMVDGDELEAGRVPPVGASTLLNLSFRGSSLLLPMILTQSGWKVDERFVMASIDETPVGGPEDAARHFMYCLFGRDEPALKTLLTSSTPADMALLMKGNSFPGGDLDQLISLVEEMPVARARDGEVFRMPGGGKATASAANIIVVGLYGVVELPFEMRQVDGTWRVVPQPYIDMMHRQGDI